MFMYIGLIIFIQSLFSTFLVNILFILGAVVSLAWLAVGFHLSALNTPGISMVEHSARGTTCSAYK